MTVAYIESSAVLSWLLGEPDQRAVLAALGKIDRVVTSALTVVECSRAIVRARETGRKQPAEALTSLRVLDDAAATWSVMEISGQITERACRAFPLEPVRSLDAIHLATAEVISKTLGTICVISLDRRVRNNARAMGMTVVPPKL